MTTRKATLNDIEQLSTLFDQYRVFYKKESDKGGAVQFLTERMTHKESEIFVAENGEGNLTGFVQLYPIFSSTRMKRLWLLNDLFVDAGQRGKGISVQLIDKAKELAKQSRSAGLILETDKTNLIGNRLYPRTDFVLDEAHNYYSWTVDV